MNQSQKAKRVLQELGRPAAGTSLMAPVEIDDLARLYEAHIAPKKRLPAAFETFWVKHQKRLADAKATSETTDEDKAPEEPEAPDETDGAG